MAEYIERKALRDTLYDADAITMSSVKILNQFPGADVAPVRRGWWKMNSNRPDNIICTNCDVGFDVWKHESKDFNYCPNCGAKMDLE